MSIRHRKVSSSSPPLWLQLAACRSHFVQIIQTFSTSLYLSRVGRRKGLALAASAAACSLYSGALLLSRGEVVLKTVPPPALLAWPGRTQ